MARLGELLVETGVLTTAQVDQALRAQVMWGGRIGTNLIELGFIDLDGLSSALGAQLKMPAALARHFAKADPELQQRLPPDLAERYSCVPLVRVGPSKEQVAVVSIELLGPKARTAIARELMIERDALVNAIAAELRVRYHLEAVYKIPRGARYLRARGKTVPPFPQFQVSDEPAADIDAAVEAALAIFSNAPPVAVVAAPVVVEEPPPPAEEDLEIPVEVIPPDEQFEEEVATSDMNLDDEISAVTALPDERTGRERRRYIRTIADEPPPDSQPQASLGRMRLRKIARAASETRQQLGATLETAVRAIKRATDRDKVADMIMQSLERFVPNCHAAMLLVVRGDTAIGWKGFHRAGLPIHELGVPLDQPGLLVGAIARVTTSRCKFDDLTSIDRLLVDALQAPDGELVVVPVPIAGRVMCIVAMTVERDEPSLGAEAIATAAGAAFARLMRDASR